MQKIIISEKKLISKEYYNILFRELDQKLVDKLSSKCSSKFYIFNDLDEKQRKYIRQLFSHKQIRVLSDRSLNPLESRFPFDLISLIYKNLKLEDALLSLRNEKMVRNYLIQEPIYDFMLSIPPLNKFYNIENIIITSIESYKIVDDRRNHIKSIKFDDNRLFNKFGLEFLSKFSKLNRIKILDYVNLDSKIKLPQIIEFSSSNLSIHYEKIDKILSIFSSLMKLDLDDTSLITSDIKLIEYPKIIKLKCGSFEQKTISFPNLQELILSHSKEMYVLNFPKLESLNAYYLNVKGDEEDNHLLEELNYTYIQKFEEGEYNPYLILPKLKKLKDLSIDTFVEDEIKEIGEIQAKNLTVRNNFMLKYLNKFPKLERLYIPHLDIKNYSDEDLKVLINIKTELEFSNLNVLEHLISGMDLKCKSLIVRYDKNVSSYRVHPNIEKLEIIDIIEEDTRYPKFRKFPNVKFLTTNKVDFKNGFDTSNFENIEALSVGKIKYLSIYSLPDDLNKFKKLKYFELNHDFIYSDDKVKVYLGNNVTHLRVYNIMLLKAIIVEDTNSITHLSFDSYSPEIFDIYSDDSELEQLFLVLNEFIKKCPKLIRIDSFNFDENSSNKQKFYNKFYSTPRNQNILFIFSTIYESFIQWIEKSSKELTI